jgi:hypothetical protein
LHPAAAEEPVGKVSDLMSVFPRRIATSLGLSSEDEHKATSILGQGHPLTRAVSLQRTLVTQALVTGGALVLGLAGWLTVVPAASLEVAAALLVELFLVLAWLCVRARVRARSESLIASGDDVRQIPVIGRERGRLGSRRVRESLARSLEHLLRDAQQWHQLLPSARPLPGVECLRDAAPEVADVVARLRSENPRVQGVALTRRLLIDGHSSPLYSGNARLLREELCRIRYLLEPGVDVGTR